MSERYTYSHGGSGELTWITLFRDGQEIAVNDAVLTLNAQSARIAALEAEAAELRRRAEVAERERDRLIEHWPDRASVRDKWVQPSAILGGREWQVMSHYGLLSKHKTRTEAVRAAAGIERAGQAGWEPAECDGSGRACRESNTSP